MHDTEGFYDNSDKSELILSHSHKDHYELIKYLNPQCRIYLGRATKKIIEITNFFTNKESKIKSFQYIESGKNYYFYDIQVTPYLMDHSTFDTYSFVIKADGKSIFYSGDFRMHGRKAKIFDWFRYKGASPLSLRFTRRPLNSADSGKIV